MKRITLLCTVHNENGRCDEASLLAILKAISPEVIFEELCPSDFAPRYSNRALHTLEMRAIISYLKEGVAKQIPVDAYMIPENFRAEQMRLEDHVARYSEAYGAQFDEIDQMIWNLGFPYLNSARFIEQFSRSERHFERVIRDYGDDAMKVQLARWNEQLRARENAMLDNIHDYCLHNTFNEGVFLVGVGHMARIVEGVKHRAKQEPGLVDWKIWGEHYDAEIAGTETP